VVVIIITIIASCVGTLAFITTDATPVPAIANHTNFTVVGRAGTLVLLSY
jgi:hypothetical protein